LKNLLNTAVIVLAVGLACMVVAPFLFTRRGFISFSETGQIGETIGGVTAPITSLIGSILVFLALKAQVTANNITRGQITNQKLEEQRKKEVVYTSNAYKFFFYNIQRFETKYYKGHRAIMKVMSLLVELERKNAHDEGRLYYGTAAELYGILKLGKILLQQINNSSIEEHDKHYFKELVKYHYDLFILPYLTRNSEKPACEVCGEMHNGIPYRMLALIKETISLF
jgi:hypothetical protein